jgi:hypothetical protein
MLIDFDRTKLAQFVSVIVTLFKRIVAKFKQCPEVLLVCRSLNKIHDKQYNLNEMVFIARMLEICNNVDNTDAKETWYKYF